MIFKEQTFLESPKMFLQKFSTNFGRKNIIYFWSKNFDQMSSTPKEKKRYKNLKKNIVSKKVVSVSFSFVYFSLTAPNI